MSRPFELDPLFRAVTTLPGVGPKNGKLFEKLTGGGKVLDLLFHKPVDFIDRRFSPELKDAPNGKIATLEVRIEKHMPAARRGLPSRVKATDGTGSIDIVFFNANKEWIAKQLPIGEVRLISGKVEHYQGQAQMVHPDMIGKPDERAAIETIEPIYPLTAGLTNKTTRKAVQGALGLLPKLPEWLDSAHKTKNKWPDWHKGMEALHNPTSTAGLSPAHPARSRLAYDELLANQLALALVRLHQRKQNGRAWKNDGHLRKKILESLPFDLTGAQKRAIDDIDKDMHEPLRMLRLIQGDVGSGKTIVAALAMMNVIECGAQAAIMAPTEILARQHEVSFGEWLDKAGVSHVTLTGRNKGKERQEILERIASGEAQVVIGTHALFQESIEFKDLGLAVIDEQHRFGVHQRLQLSQKSKGTDVLVMTATPIPRTLTLTAYGDMEVSRIDEKPPGRKPVDTRLIPKEKVEAMIDAVAGQIQKGAQVYWVCPLVEESEKLDLEAAEARYDVLKERFGAQVGLVHGRLKADEKDLVMNAFARGEIKILVATTVIEVGVNVPNASIMVIEQAERFGLSQLHQLRGRVGRGNTKSFCFLVYAAGIGKTAKERLRMMRETEDGFLIAEKDLELRGGGEILGTRQSGMPEFKLADITAHGDLLVAARDDTKLILSKDEHLESDRGKALKTLLYLFEQDQAITRLRAG
ncbi:MAG TPA: ATP-dependent DNA helicase RecG [Alphaproteobacteria bacterium]|nr:ATP-dependent DNA helicase RecG [Alphaproteobacteria bacterium]